MSKWKKLEEELEEPKTPPKDGTLEDIEWSDAESVTPDMIVREDAAYGPDGKPVKGPAYERSTIPGLPPRPVRPTKPNDDYEDN